MQPVELDFGNITRTANYTDIDDLLKPVRKEDKGSDLWSVFNVVQEKIIDGDFDYTIGSKFRKARQIKNFKQDIKLNQELFALASEYVA